MDYYHWSNTLYEPNTFMPIGTFGRWISNQGPLAQQFERLMEERRLLVSPDAPSRSACIFMLKPQEAEGFEPRQCLYKLQPARGAAVSQHNYKVGTYFSELISLGNQTQILLETALMDAYWLNNGPYGAQTGQPLHYIPEFLTDQPTLIAESR